MTKNYQYLIDVYKATLDDSKLYINTRSSHWDEWYEKNKKFFKLENLINFRNNRVLSAGLDDSINIGSKLDLYEFLENFDSDFLKKNLPNKNVGNCDNTIKLLGYYFDFGIIHHLKWYEKIESYINNNSKIIEIGGGFGSLARIIIKNKNIKYFLIDLPEANLQSNFYLQNHFPDKKIFNYLDFKNKNIENEIENYDIFILPPNAIKILTEKNFFFDFVINSRSFMEMKKETIVGYFNFIQKKTNIDGYFLNINRYSKSVVGEDIKFKDYPYDDFWNVVISEKSFLQEDHSHFMLTIRKRNGEKGNIKNELQNLQSDLSSQKKHFRKLMLFKNNLKKFTWVLINKSLTFLFGKSKIRKLSKIFYNMSIK